ncbi:MoaD/ThiS family protein [Vallitalea okinawensis]|uniref:MoaD/ThiS family protein n=1 Tax=Vallitalea okinawensis TaxID=2078660 RepID=UPI000CFAE797|nr:MoaD/ThiS family protein [Vallitalea okinawensis]
MRVKVYAPMFIKTVNIDDDGYVELKDGSRVKELLRRIKIPVPLSPLLMCSVNYKPAKVSTPLEDGDIITFINIVSGG